MQSFIKFLVTFFGGIAISIILFIISFIISIIAGIAFAAMGMDIQSKTTLILLTVINLIIVALPYAMIVSFVFHNGLSKCKTDKYGMLGGPFSQEAVCWLFNCFTLPYYLISLKYPPKYTPKEAPPENYNTKFIAGWIFGFILMMIIVVVQNLTVLM